MSQLSAMAVARCTSNTLFQSVAVSRYTSAPTLGADGVGR